MGSERKMIGRLRILFVGAGVAGMLVCVQAVFGSPKPAVVRATIWPNLIITVAPKTFRHGTVVFKVKNRDTQSHRFSINGAETTKIGPGKSVALTVTFRKPSTYEFTLPDYEPTAANGYQAAVGGTVKVT